MSTDFKTDNAYSVIKGKFKATASSSFGLFIVFVDNVTKNIDRFDIISSHFSTVYENNVNMPWSELEDMITKMKWKGEYATNLTHDIQNSMEDMFEPGTGRAIDIWHALKKAQLAKVNSIFEEYMTRPTGDKNIKVDVGTEIINKSDIEKVKQEREIRENQENMGSKVASEPQKPTQPNLEESSVVLEISLVLSPINGTTLLELQTGDKILVKISEQSSRGQYFIDLFNASNDTDILPIPATLESVTQDGKFFHVLVNIGPGVYGKSIVEDNVKVRKYDPNRDKGKISAGPANIQPAPDPLKQDLSGMMNTEEKEPKIMSKNIIFFIIGGLALLLLLIIVILFI